MPSEIPGERIRDCIRFHGHSCPGLAIGIRAAELALRELDNPESPEIVAIAETDMCGVDAIQFLTGATLGKGNLILRDFGKTAFSFFRRDTGQGLRAVFNPDARGTAGEKAADIMRKMSEGTATEEEKKHAALLRREMQERFLGLPLEEMFTVTRLEKNPPRPARVLESLTCQACGEQVMESRTRRFSGQTLCIPCFEQVEQKA